MSRDINDVLIVPGALAHMMLCTVFTMENQVTSIVGLTDVLVTVIASNVNVIDRHTHDGNFVVFLCEVGIFVSAPQHLEVMT